MNSLPTLLCKKNEKEYSIHSTYNPIKEGERLFANPNNDPILFICIGLGYGFHLKSVCTNNIPLLVIEEERLAPTPPKLGEGIFTYTKTEFQKLLLKLKNYLSEHANDKISVKIVSLPGYERYNPQFCNNIKENILLFINSLKQELATIKHFQKQWNINWAKNQKMINTVKEIPNWKNKQIIVAAAGPSLNDSLDMIKKGLLEEKILLSTDTALPSLVANEIIPHFVLTIDCQHYSLHHHQIIPRKIREKISLILDAFSSTQLTTLYSKFHFVFPPHNLFENRKTYKTGGNVTYSAISISKLWGAKEVEIFGADFSYQTPNGKISYCKENYYDYQRKIHQTKCNSIETSTYKIIADTRNEQQLKTYKEQFLNDFKNEIKSDSQDTKSEFTGYYRLIF